MESRALFDPALKLMAHGEPPVTIMLALVSDPHENLNPATLQPASAGFESIINRATTGIAIFIITAPSVHPDRKKLIAAI